MARGKGVRLQRYKDGGLADARVFTLKDRLTWRNSSQRLWTVGGRRSQGMDRQSCRSRAAAAQGIPPQQSLG